MNKIKEIFDKVFPKYDFWNNFVSKLFSFAVSFKVWVVALASVFLVLEHIDGKTWATAVVAITLGRVVVQGVQAAKKAAKDMSLPTVISQIEFEKIISDRPRGE